ncbi:MAG: NADH-quinone oxidoreductase subunit L [Acidobacteria bacterium RIFCSPLOWO2_12_FULL_67_14b]|nr:MAG: NADH-quinone oxidoreductase subunit L [Acidobacteria bacterium RIFCSPLOWO2_12_FULL_67_14b]
MLALIPLLPFAGFLVNATMGKRLPKNVSGGLASLLMVIAFVIAAAQVWALAAIPAESRQINQTLYTWISAGNFSVDLAFRLDALSAVMILVVTGVGSLIHIYSTSYMHEETAPEFARYFAYLNLFCFFMLLLVLGSNVLVMFVGWEGVGLCSYLLIGFYYAKKSASDAAKKAFIVNRVGDFAFILGALAMFMHFHSLDFTTVALAAKAMPIETAGFGILSLITLLMFIGATGKSAQIPLYVWLPDAMEGPTPVSALIHAATMVTAGVYMIGRTAVLFEHAPITMSVVAVIGAATALLAGTIGLVQNDIKRVLAYSTVSQLGYMFLAMGVGAFGAGIFHLYTHAFFKALLFLGSGAVIHALHGQQDIRHMGGLKKHLPITYWTFLIGALAIAGVPLLSGFFSKDEILYETFLHGHYLLWGVAAVTSLLTATYMFRLVHLTFHGEERFAGAHAPASTHAPEHSSTHAPVHLHDAPAPMAFALIVLAAGSIFAGYIGLPHAFGHNVLNEWLQPAFQATNCGAPVVTGELAGLAIEECLPGEELGGEAHTGLELSLMGVSTLIAFAGIGLATFLWVKRRDIPARLAQQYAGVHRLLLNKYYVDEVYDATIVQPIKVVSEEGLWRGFDVKVVDGAVNGAGYFVSGVSILLRLLQNGSVKTYAASTFVGAVAILAYYLWR